MQVAEAAGRLEDPMTKNATAADLFGGKLGKQLVPMLGELRTKMNEVPQGAIISEATIKSAKDFDDTLAHLKITVKSFTAETFGNFSAAFSFMALNDGGPFIDRIIGRFTGASKNIKLLTDDIVAGMAKVSAAQAGTAAVGEAAISNADRLALHLKSLTRDALAPLNAEEKRYLDAAMAANESTADSAKWLGASEAAIRKYEDAQKAAAEAVKQHTAAVAALEDKIRNVKADQAARDLAEAVQKLGGISRLSADDQKRLADEVGKLFTQGAKLDPLLVDLAVRFGELDPKVTEGTAAFEHLGETIKTITLPAAILINEQIDALQKKITAGFSGLGAIGEKVGDGFSEGAKKIEEAAQRDIRALGELAQAFNQTASIAQSTGHTAAASVFSSFGGMTTNLEAAAKANEKWGGSAGIASAMFSDQASGTEKAAAGISSGLAVVNGAMDVWSATAHSGGMAASAFAGTMAGAKAGAAFGPWGAAVGAAAGAIVGLVRGATAGRRAVEDFATSLGGFDALHAKLDALPTGQGETLWKELTQGTAKGDPKAAQAAIDKVTAALAAGDAATKQFDTDAGGVFQKIAALGGNVDASMLPYLNDLAKANKLSTDNIALLGTMSGDGKPTYQQLDALAQKYNLTLDQMGQGFQGAKIHDEFQSLIDDMDELQRGGVDLGAVLTKTGDDGKLALSDLGTSVQNVIDQSMKYGQDIPENMKPAAQALIDQGLLLDANGNKITDINQLKFGESMQTSLDTLNKTLKDLIDSLHTLSGTTATPTIAPKYVPPGNAPPDTPAPAMPAYGGAQAEGGDYYVTQPTMFLAGEAGPEAVSFGGANGKRGGGSTASTVPIHVHVMMPDGRTLAEVVVPHIPVVVQEYGLTSMSTWAFSVNGVLTPIQVGWNMQLTTSGRNRFVGKFFSHDASFRPALDASIGAYERVAIARIAAGNPTVITTAEPHGLVSGQMVNVGGVTGNVPSSLNSTLRCTVTGPTTFSVPIATTTAGTGGVAERAMFGGYVITPRERGQVNEPVAGIVTEVTAVSFDQMTERRYAKEVLVGGTLKSMLTTLVAHYIARRRRQRHPGRRAGAARRPLRLRARAGRPRHARGPRRRLRLGSRPAPASADVSAGERARAV